MLQYLCLGVVKQLLLRMSLIIKQHRHRNLPYYWLNNKTSQATTASKASKIIKSPLPTNTPQVTRSSSQQPQATRRIKVFSSPSRNTPRQWKGSRVRAWRWTSKLCWKISTLAWKTKKVKKVSPWPRVRKLPRETPVYCDNPEKMPSVCTTKHSLCARRKLTSPARTHQVRSVPAFKASKAFRVRRKQWWKWIDSLRIVTLLTRLHKKSSSVRSHSTCLPVLW